MYFFKAFADQAPQPHPPLLSAVSQSWWRLYACISPPHAKQEGWKLLLLETPLLSLTGLPTDDFSLAWDLFWCFLSADRPATTRSGTQAGVFSPIMVFNQEAHSRREWIYTHMVVMKQQTISCLSVCFAELEAQTFTLILCSITSTRQYKFCFERPLLACCLRSCFVISQINQRWNYINSTNPLSPFLLLTALLSLPALFQHPWSHSPH